MDHIHSFKVDIDLTVADVKTAINIFYGEVTFQVKSEAKMKKNFLRRLEEAVEVKRAYENAYTSLGAERAYKAAKVAVMAGLQGIDGHSPPIDMEGILPQWILDKWKGLEIEEERESIVQEMVERMDVKMKINETEENIKVARAKYDKKAADFVVMNKAIAYMTADLERMKQESDDSSRLLGEKEGAFM
jgi:hypothetical protein